MVLRIRRSRNPLRENWRFPKNHVIGGVVILLALLSIFSSGQIPLVRAATAPTGSYFDHVVVIVMENEGIDNICGSHPPPCNGANNPYMSGLANNYTLGLQSTSISCSGCPTSQPNYVALLSGSNQGCSSGGCPSPITAPNLVDRLESAGLTWKGYFENQIISGQPFQGCDSNSNSEPYNPLHNPFIVFQDITTNTARCSRLVDANPSSCAVTDCALVNDLNSASAPNFMWLTPNDCDNIHAASVCTNGCTSNNGQSSTCMQDGDKYLKSLIPNILKSNTFTTTRSALFITFDEGLSYCPLNGSSEDCIYAAWAGPQAKNGFHSSNLYNHYSFTKTIEVNWNLPSLASGDGSANAMTEFFNTQPDFTVAANPSSVTFNSGGSSSFTTTVSPVNSFTGTVTLTTSTSPSTGLGVGCNPTTISGGSGSSTCTLNSSAPGSYTVTVTGTSGSLRHSATVSVTVTQPSTPDFSMSANPTSLTITQGSSGTSTISLASLNSFSDTISLSAQVSPTGPSASLNPPTVTLAANGRGSSTLNVTTGSAVIGSYSVNVTGTSGSLSHSVKVNVSVNPPADFTISASPNSLTLGQGSSSTMTPVTVTTSGDRTWFESSYLSASFYAQGLIWLFFEDSSKTCEGVPGCLLYTTSSTGSSWTTPTNVGVHVTDSDFSVYTDGTNVYYVRYDEVTFESTCGKNIFFRTGTLAGSLGTVNWQAEQVALKGLSTNTYPNDEITVDSTGQAWIAFLSDSHSACGGNGTDLPQIIHSSGTNYASWTTPLTLSTAHSNNWHIALVSLGSGEIYASYWLRGSDLHGRLYNGTSWNFNLPDEQISSTTTQNDVNAWLFNSGTNVYAIYFDNTLETFNFATRSSSGTWTTNVIGVGESRTGTTFSSSYYSFPDAASYDATHNQFYLLWMNATLQRIDEWKGAGSTWTKTTKIAGTTAVPYPDSITSFITSSPTNSFPTTGGIFYVSGSSAPFTYNFVALPLSGGSTGTFTVTITSQNGFTNTVNLATSISPSTGLTVNCSPANITGGSGSSTCTVTGSTAGNYNVTVTGTSGSLSHSTSVSVSVQTSSPDFTISSSPTSATVSSGVSGTSTVAIAPLNGFSGTVTLAATTNSTSLSCTLSSNTITGGSGSATLSCTDSTAGNYLATVTGTSGSLSHSTSVTYHVQDFAVVATPASVSVTTSAAGTSTISVSSLNGFTGTVSLAATSNSTNMSCSLSSTSIGGASGTSTLSCSANIPGNYLATITGSSGGVSHSATATYHVTAAPDFSISANPTNMNVNAGATGISTITVSPLNGFTGTVTLVVATNSTSLSCNLSATTISGGSGTSTLSCAGSAPSNYLATVNGTSASLSHLATVTYHAQDFSISANPTSMNVSLAVAGTSTITVASLNGFVGTVALGVTTNSSNLACVLSSNGITGGSGTSTLSCNSSLPGNYLATVTGTNNSLSHTTSVTYHISVLTGFAMSADPTLVTPNVGGLGNSTITVSPVNGFTGTVLISVTTNSTSLACTASPSAISGGSGQSILSCRGSSSANYLANVTGTSGGISHSVAVTYTVTDFSISAYAVPLTVGSSSGFVTVKSILGLSGNVSLSLSMPSGLNGSCPSSLLLPSGGTTTVQCNFTSISPGVYSVNVTGSTPCSSCSIGHVSHTTTFSVTINDFSLSIAHSSVTIYPGFSGVLNALTVSAFNGTVSLSATNLPNVSFTLSPSAITFINGNNLCGCTSEMDVSSTSAAALGTYTVNVTGTVGSITHTVSMTLIIASPDFTLTLGGSSQSIPLGGPADTFVDLNGVNGFYGNVNLVVASSSSAIACQFLSGNSANTPLGNNITVSLPFGSETVILSCTAVGPVGVFNATVTGTSGSLVHSAIFTVTIMDYSISATPVSFSAGSSGNSTVTVTSLHGLSGTVSLSVSSPSGLTASCPTSVNLSSGGSSSVQCKFTSTVPGTYSTNVTGTLPCINCSSSGIIVHSALSSVTVSMAMPDFTLSADSGTLTIPQGSSATSSVSTTSINGFAGTISLAASVSPVGLSTSFNLGTISLTAGATRGSTLNVTALGAAPGTYNVNVTAMSGSLSHSLIIVVTVTSVAKPSYALVVSYEGFVYKLYPNNTLTLIGQPVTTPLSAVAWKPDGSCAIIAGNAAVLIRYDGTKLTIMPTGLSTTINFFSVAWRPDGSYALIGGSGGALLKYDCTTVTQISNSFAVSYRAVSWNPSGTQALLVSYFGKIYQYQSSTGQVIQLASPTSQNLDAVAWNPNGSYALLAGSGGAILSYNGTSFQVLNTAGTYSSSLTVRYISFNPTGSMALLVGDSGLVLTYNGSSLTALPVLTSSTLYSVSWSAGTAYIVGGGGTMLTYSGGTVKNVPTGTFSGFRGIAWKPN